MFPIKSYSTLYIVLSVVWNVLLTTHNDDHMTNKGKLLSSMHSMIQQLNQKSIYHCLRFHVHTKKNIYMGNPRNISSYVSRNISAYDSGQSMEGIFLSTLVGNSRKEHLWIRLLHGVFLPTLVDNQR